MADDPYLLTWLLFLLSSAVCFAHRHWIQVNRHAHSKKTVKRARSVHKQVKINKKKNKAAHSDNSGLFPAINLLHDPQGMAEKVFRRLRQSKQRFEVNRLEQ